MKTSFIWLPALLMAACVQSPGESLVRGDGALRPDITHRIIGFDSMVEKQCRDRSIAKTEVLQAKGTKQRGVSSTGVPLAGRWSERWTVNRCGELVAYIVEFTADGRGGAYWAMHLETVVNTPAPEIDRAENPPSKIRIIQAPGETPLLEACNAGDVEACRLLETAVRYAAAMNGDAAAQNDLGTRLLQGQEGPEDFAEGLEWISKAAEQGHAGAQSSLSILLRNAARKGESEKVRDLVKSGVDVNAKNETGYTALMFAAMLGHAEIVDTLIEAGADANAENDQRVTALMGAVVGGDTGIVKALLRAGADVNVVSTLGDTALMLAAKSGDGAEIVEILRDAGADVDNQNEIRGLDE